MSSTNNTNSRSRMSSTKYKQNFSSRSILVNILGSGGLFEGDMKLTGDQLLALKWGTVGTHGDFGRVTYFSFFDRKHNSKSKKLKHQGKCREANTESSKCHHWEQLHLAWQHRQVDFNCYILT